MTRLSQQWKARMLSALFAFLLLQPADAQQRHANGIDDYLQYAPYASVLALKACGMESRDDWPRLLTATAASWVVSAGTAYTLKHAVSEWRPDHTDRRSFPSGHATIAFAGATLLRKEYGHVSPWIPVVGYGVATFTAVDRVLKDRHHWYDVGTGAALGIGAAELTCYVADRLLKTPRLSVALTGNRLDVSYRW